MDTERANDLLQQIGSAVVNDPAFAGHDWHGIALVSIIGDGVRELSGYWYDAAGKGRPEIPDDDTVDDLFAAFRDASQAEGSAPWKSCLFRIRREGMRVSVDFEYDDRSRWKVTPANLATLVAELRPV